MVCLSVKGSSKSILIAWDSLLFKKLDEFVGNFSVSIFFTILESEFEWMLSGVYGP